MKPNYTFLFLLMISCLVYAQEEETEKEKNEMTFKLLRQDDVINIENSESFYQNLKQLKLSENTTLSFGGSYRFQTEGFINEQFDSEVDEETDAWFLHRLMLHSHLKIDDKFEFFAELNSSLVHSKENLIPVDKDELSVNQLFMRYHFTPEWNLFVGRQNMRLGSGRLIDIREGPNVRLSFDMAQLQYQKNNTTISAFHAIPVQQQEGVFDNDFLEDNEALSTLYWTQHWNTATNTDVYVLYKTEDQKTWNAGTADDERVSLGLRHFGEWKGLKYNNEFVFQFGTFGDRDIRAWTASFNIEKPFSFGTLGLKTEAISGDDNDDSLNTFDGLYPRGAYFGRVARFGPSNLFDIHPYYDFKLGEISLELDYVAFWRFSLDDGVYGPPLILDYQDVNNERFIGQQIGAIAAYELNEFMAFELESNVIFPGRFLQESDLGDTLYHFVFTMELKF